MRSIFFIVGATMLCFALSGLATAALIINENSAWPSTPAFQTFTPTPSTVSSERDMRFNRNLLQTFQLGSTIQIDKIFIDYEEGVAGKEVTLRIFTVPNVNAASILDPDGVGYSGTVLLSGLSFTTTAGIITANSANDPVAVLEMDLTGTDEITLPATTGTEGYAFQFLRTGAGSTSDATGERAFKWHFGGNEYAGGRAFQVNGTGGPGGTSDFTLAITVVPEPSALALGLVGLVGCAILRRRMNGAGVSSRGPLLG